MIVSIFHKSYPLPSSFPQDPATWVQSFRLDATHADSQSISAPTVPITVVPPADKLPIPIQTTSALNFIASTVSSVVTPASSIPRPCSHTMTLSWTQPGTSSIMRSMREIEVLEMELQDYKEGNVIDVWDSLPFSPIPSSPPSHFLWDMITNNKGISSEIWDHFIGSNVLSIAF